MSSSLGSVMTPARRFKGRNRLGLRFVFERQSVDLPTGLLRRGAILRLVRAPLDVLVAWVPWWAYCAPLTLVGHLKRKLVILSC